MHSYLLYLSTPPVNQIQNKELEMVWKEVGVV
jgi:hypothetical protein